MKWLTQDIPGTGGIYKENPEDFQVEEIPLYPCCGEGEHLYLWIEKRGISTRSLVGQLGRGLQLHEREIGYAGLKDARALTRQMVSIPGKKADQLPQLTLENAQILKSQRHSNKLRLGHLAGNRFRIRLRQTFADAADRAEAILARLQQLGVPNFFGEQRYGSLGNSARLGRLLLQHNYQAFCREFIGDPRLIRNPDWQRAAELFRAGQLAAALQQLPRTMRDEHHLLDNLQRGQSCRDAVNRLPRNLLRLFLSATQSELFDTLLHQRLSRLNQLEDGDVAIKLSNGACFRVTEAAQEQPRVERFEISPSAPLYGTKVMLARGKPGEREKQLLDETGISLDSWRIDRLTMPGERRPLRVPLNDAQVGTTGAHELTLEFALPKGSYATCVLQEIIKP
jgi:tRNA pseudouridine13 synthase